MFDVGGPAIPASHSELPEGIECKNMTYLHSQWLVLLMNPALFSLPTSVHVYLLMDTSGVYVKQRAHAKQASFPLQEDEIGDLGPVMRSCCLAGHQRILTKLNGDHSPSERRQRGRKSGKPPRGRRGQ